MTEMTTIDLALCARCSRVGKTCCQTTDIYVTPGDVERIARVVGNMDFFEFRPPTDPRYLDQNDDPLWAAHVFKPGGLRRVLRRDPLLNCWFLGDRGCILSLDARPLICRLHPFVYTSNGLDEELSRDCPSSVLQPGMSIETELNLSRKTAEDWRSLLYAEIIEGEKA